VRDAPMRMRFSAEECNSIRMVWFAWIADLWRALVHLGDDRFAHSFLEEAQMAPGDPANLKSEGAAIVYVCVIPQTRGPPKVCRCKRSQA